MPIDMTRVFFEAPCSQPQSAPSEVIRPYQCLVSQLHSVAGLSSGHPLLALHKPSMVHHPPRRHTSRIRPNRNQEQLRNLSRSAVGLDIPEWSPLEYFSHVVTVNRRRDESP